MKGKIEKSEKMKETWRGSGKIYKIAKPENFK